jgi:hypothetical protein
LRSSNARFSCGTSFSTLFDAIESGLPKKTGISSGNASNLKKTKTWLRYFEGQALSISFHLLHLPRTEAAVL